MLAALASALPAIASVVGGVANVTSSVIDAVNDEPERKPVRTGGPGTVVNVSQSNAGCGRPPLSRSVGGADPEPVGTRSVLRGVSAGLRGVASQTRPAPQTREFGTSSDDLFFRRDPHNLMRDPEPPVYVDNGTETQLKSW